MSIKNKGSYARVVSLNNYEHGNTEELEKLQRQKLRSVMETVPLESLKNKDTWFDSMVKLLDGFLSNRPKHISSRYECIYVVDGVDKMIFDVYYGLGDGLSFDIRGCLCTNSYAAMSCVVFSGEVASDLEGDFKRSYETYLNNNELWLRIRELSNNHPFTVITPSASEHIETVELISDRKSDLTECPHCQSRNVSGSDICTVCARYYISVYEYPVTLSEILSRFDSDLSELNHPYLNCDINSVYLELEHFINDRTMHDCVPESLVVLCDMVTTFYENADTKFASYLNNGRALSKLNDAQYYYRESSKLLQLVDEFSLALLDEDKVTVVEEMTLKEAFDNFNRYFISGNNVPVDQKVTVDKAEWFKLRDLILRDLDVSDDTTNEGDKEVVFGEVTDSQIEALKAADEAVQELVEELVSIVKPTKH